MNRVPPNYNQNGGWPQNSPFPGNNPFPPQVPYWERPEYQEKKKLRHISNVMGWGSIGIQLLMVILAQVLFGVLSGIGYPLRFDLYDSAYLSPTMYYLLNCVVYIIAVVLPFLLCLTLMKLPVNDTFRFEKVGIGTAVLCVLFGVGFCMFSNIPTNIVVTFLDEMGYNTTFPESPEADTILASILNVISISIIPALVEEFAFRGVILSQLRKYGNGFAVVGSALLFGMFHMNYVQLPFAFLVGLVLGWLMIRTNNLWIPIFIHGLNNALSLLFEYLGNTLPQAVYDQVNTALFLGLMLVGLIALILMKTLCGQRFRRNPMEQQPQMLSLSARTGAFTLNPGFIVFLLLFLAVAGESLIS